MHKINIIGHRGAKGYVAENTLESFGKALAMGVDGIELDVHLSADGEIIVIHDETVDRTTDGQGFVKDLSLPQIKDLLIDGQFTVPTLRELFDLVDRKCLINVELKAYETAEPVVKLIEHYVVTKHWKYSDFLISSFDWAALQRVRDLHAEIPLGVLTGTDLDLAIAFATFVKAETIHPYFHLLTAQNTKEMQRKNLKVYTWTVNDLQDIVKVKSLEVDGIITDYPDRV